MTNQCIFCGKELKMMQKKKLYCGNTNQTICVDCYGKYKNLSAVERAEAALKTGRADEREKLRDYLETVQEAQAQRAEETAQKDRARVSDLKCLRCGGDMLAYGPLTVKLGEETYFFSDLNRLLSGSLTMELYRCSSCGKAEFFIPNDRALSDL